MMGVSSRRRYSCEQADHVDMVLIEHYLDEPECVEASAAVLTGQQHHGGHKKTNYKSMVRTEMSRLSRRRTGVRQARRCENMNFLLSLVDGSVDDSGDMMTEIVEPSTSPLSALFMEKEKMKIWNDFINRSEEEQCRVLHEGSVEKVTDEDNILGPELDASFDCIDKRDVHPGYSATECYKRIDTGLKTFLKQKHIPLGVLEHLEAEIIPFFEEWPSSIFISHLPSSINRLLLHALCQYLDLFSRSFDDDSGLRQTQVENKMAWFIRPELTLSQYLDQRH